VPAQLVQAHQVGQAVEVAVRPDQGVDALSLVQGLKCLQVPYQLTQDLRFEQRTVPSGSTSIYRRQ
jgi:hypothetical protein